MAHIQAENLQNVQKMRFWQKALGVNGLKGFSCTIANVNEYKCTLFYHECHLLLPTLVTIYSVVAKQCAMVNKMAAAYLQFPIGQFFELLFASMSNRVFVFRLHVHSHAN